MTHEPDNLSLDDILPPLPLAHATPESLCSTLLFRWMCVALAVLRDLSWVQISFDTAHPTRYCLSITGRTFGHFTGRVHELGCGLEGILSLDFIITTEHYEINNIIYLHF